MEKSGSRRGRVVELRLYGPAERMRRVIAAFHGRVADRHGGCGRTKGTGLCDRRKSGQRTQHAGISLAAQLVGGRGASAIMNQTTWSGVGADQAAIDCAIQAPPRPVEAADSREPGAGTQTTTGPVTGSLALPTVRSRAITESQGAPIMPANLCCHVNLATSMNHEWTTASTPDGRRGH